MNGEWLRIIHDVRHLDMRAPRTGAFVQALAARTLPARIADKYLRRFLLDHRVVGSNDYLSPRR